MKIHHFRLKDSQADRGQIDIAILATSVALAFQALCRELERRNRADLGCAAFRLARAYPLNEVVFSNLEPGQ